MYSCPSLPVLVTKSSHQDLTQSTLIAENGS